MTISKLSSFLSAIKKDYMPVEQEERPVFLYVEKNKVKPVGYLEFVEDIKNHASAYADIKEERIAISAGNSYTWIVNLFAMIWAGKQVILLDPNLNEKDYIGLVHYCDSEAIVTTEDIAEELDFLPKDMPVYTFEQIKEQSRSCELPDLSDQGSLICFTSGTSKNSKGVVVKIDALIGMGKLVREGFPVIGNKRCFLPVPFFHIYAICMMFNCMSQKSCICIGTSPRRFQQEIESLDPELAFFVPSMLRFFLDHRIQVPSLKWVSTGGSPCPEAVAEQAVKEGYIYYNLYGSSETLGLIAYCPPGGDGKTLQPIPPIRFFKNEDEEIGVYLPYHMLEYYKKPEDTREVLDGDIFWTGDSGIINEYGHCRIMGRIRDMIVFENGEKIHADDKDNDLSELPHIEEAAVFSKNGELYAAIIPDAEENWELICKAVDKYNRRFPAMMRIKACYLRKEEMPKTAKGNIRRFKLEEEYR